MHNLTKTLAAMSLLAPLTAHSLGVGDIKLHSALNQKLSAEIALSLAADEDLSDIKVSLATPDKFDKVGISWSYFLSKLKFQPVVKANGQVVVKVTSDEVVQEPFLDFLVEVSWPKGDIYKEFTVLVDPPVIYQQESVNVPVQTATQSTYNNVSNETAQNDFANLSVDGKYGPTRRNDSLWKVAERVNHDNSISVEQMMMALYKANPRAFYKKNVNALMEGKTLKIPKKSEIVQLSKKQANSQFYRQMAVWEGKAVPDPDVQQAKVSGSNSNQLTLVPPTDEKITSSSALTADTTDQESLVSENNQLQERLANLEKQFAIMQEMMAIKDQQLAVMQNSQAELNLDSDALAEKVKFANTGPVIKPVEDHLNQDASKAGNTLPIKESARNTETTIREQQTKVTPVTKPVYTVAQQSSTQKNDGDSYSYIGWGIFGALAIGGIGFLFWRRRQTEEEINENSMFATSSEIFLPDTDADDELDVPIFDERSTYDVGTVGESSFLSEFTPSDFDVFETDQAEVDPTSETDVYLAYGRYQQAEELMRQAITDHPDKDDYKLKLLEIFYTSENADAYEKYCSELVAEGKNSDLNFWSKVTEMGKEIIPGSALLSIEHTEAQYTSPEELPEGSSSLNVDDVTEFIDDTATVADISSEPAEDNSDIDFDLSEFSLQEDNSDGLLASEETVTAEADTDLESIDFDMSLFDSGDSSEINDSTDSSPVDINSDEAIESIEVNADEISDIDLDDFDFSSEDLTVSDSQESVADADNTQADEESEKSDFDFDFDFDEISDAPVAGISSGSDGEDDNNLLVSDLTDMDEFETKIDLAKAYIDMGDESAAKEIAQEVLDKGSEAQQTEAQLIMDKLS